MKAAFVITVSTEVPVDRVELAEYILEAVETWNGQMRPDNPMRSIRSVRVSNKVMGVLAESEDDGWSKYDPTWGERYG